MLNGKPTNCEPFEGKLLGESKNNGINSEDGIKNNGRFRMIFTPNEQYCNNSDIAYSLLMGPNPPFRKVRFLYENCLDLRIVPFLLFFSPQSVELRDP